MLHTPTLLQVQLTSILSQGLRLQSSLQSPRLCVIPEDSLMDQKVTVRAEGLSPGSQVTLRTVLRKKKEGIHFESSSMFVVPSSGTVDTGLHSPVSGSYTGLHSSGPIWSVSPQTGSKLRLWPGDITSPLQYTLSVSDSHTQENLCSIHATKRYMTKGVTRLEVRESDLVGTLFLPPDIHDTSTSSPAIITLYGGMNRGRVPEDRAAMLAARGAVTLALAYFGVDPLPKIYSMIDIQYFERAVTWLLARPEVAGDCVGLFGSSKGADICLAMAQFLGSMVGAVCVQGGSYVSMGGEIKYKNQTILPSVFESVHCNGGMVMDIKGGVEELERNPHRQIMFERSPAPVLGLVGSEDTATRSMRDFARFSFDRARRSGKTNCSLVELAGAGHLIDLPHSPLCQLERLPLLPPPGLAWYGGHRQNHALAQFQAWDLLTAFFHETLKL